MPDEYREESRAAEALLTLHEAAELLKVPHQDRTGEMTSDRIQDKSSFLGGALRMPIVFRERSGKHRENAMGMMIVRHKVRDYGQWRPIFDRHADMQKRAGLVNPRVYHSADSNKSEIVVVFDTEDTKKAKDFAASADLKEAMEKAGVLDTPTIYFLELID